jgi:hypothetical protein
MIPCFKARMDAVIGSIGINKSVPAASQNGLLPSFEME